MNRHGAHASFLLIVGVSSAVALGLVGGGGQDELELAWQTVDNGGGVSAGESMLLHGSIGQADAGVLSGGTFLVRGGFWPGPADAAAPRCQADLDGSGAVDAADLAMLLGAWGPSSGGCEDLTGDGTVDAADLAILLGAWGPFN